MRWQQQQLGLSQQHQIQLWHLQRQMQFQALVQRWLRQLQQLRQPQQRRHALLLRVKAVWGAAERGMLGRARRGILQRPHRGRPLHASRAGPLLVSCMGHPLQRPRHTKPRLGRLPRAGRCGKLGVPWESSRVRMPPRRAWVPHKRAPCQALCHGTVRTGWWD